MAFSFFGNKDREQSSDASNSLWTALDSVEGLDQIIADSSKRPQLIFKHSTRCIISRTVLRNFESEYQGDTMDLYLLDLISYREVSNAIASKLDVVHQSPQVVIVSNGKAIKDASHQSITADWAVA